MDSNKNKALASLLVFKDDDDKLAFEVDTLHFDFIGEVKVLMDKKGMKGKDLAKCLGVSESFISQLFTGEKHLNLKLLTKIQKVFDVRFKLSSGPNQTTQQVVLMVPPKPSIPGKTDAHHLISSVYTTNASVRFNSFKTH